MIKSTKKTFFAILLIIIGLILGLSLSSNFDINHKSLAEDRSVSLDSKNFLGRFTDSLNEVANVAKPAVVNVSTEKTFKIMNHPFGDFFNDPFFRRFFGDENPFQAPRKYKSTSLGSGVVVSKDGYILTNNHVIKDADKIKVIMHNKKEYKGKVIGTDPKTDLAVIKIKATNLQTIKIGNSDKLRVGDIVIAIGNPYGLNQTVTMGIVSAVGRSNVGIADYEDFIQTDAAINPGNSGGALVNIKGELVGVNTAIFSTSGGYQGIGFAVPSNMAKVVMESLIKEGKVIRGWLGVNIQDLTPEIAKHFGIEETKGVLIADVVEKSPAEKAGLKRGDLIIEYDGKEVSDTRQLRNMVASTFPGNSTTVTIIRDGKKKSMNVTIGEFPEKLIAESGDYENNLRGVYVQDLTPSIRNEMNIPVKINGVIVTNVSDNSLAHGVLRQGDVITEINQRKVHNVTEYRKLASSLIKDKSILLLVYRSGSFIYVTISK